jgi:hypothetical protein
MLNQSEKAKRNRQGLLLKSPRTLLLPNGAVRVTSGFNLKPVAGENVSGIGALKQDTKLSGPKVGSYIADHQNLQMKK